MFGESASGSIKFCDENVVSVLGLIWNPTSDVLSLIASPFGCDKIPTKRSIVSFVAKLFDPLG